MSSPGEPSVPKRPRRDKYISRACVACQRRKSKCSGQDPCLGCQDRHVLCTYKTGKKRSRKSHSDLQRQISVNTTMRPERRDDNPGQKPFGDMPLPPNVLENNDDIQEPGLLFTQPVHAKPLTGLPSVAPNLYMSFEHDPNRISLRSQISEMRAIFKARKDPQPQLEQEPYNSDTRYSIELPAFAKIQNSLHVYFENMSRLFPALDRENTLSRIHKALESLQYPSSGPKIDIDYAAAPTIALLCIILAIAEVNENNALSSNINSQASNFRDHARSLLQTFELLPPSLEILRCHTLTTIYLLFMDFLDLAMQSSAVTVQMAMALQLHQQSPVPRKESDDHDRNLWWTIYILDRDIACLAGTPYLIRDEEIDAPRATRDDHFERFSRAPYINCQSEFDEQATTLERSRDRDSTYLEALAYLGRLWARIWNELISNQLEPECQWQIAAVLDSQINIFQQRLPSTLVWRNTSSPGLDVENEIQRQLLVLMRINMLRLFLRRNPTSNCKCLDKNGSGCNGLDISTQTIEAIAHLGKRQEALLPIAYPISSTLVHCILYLVHSISKSVDTSKTEAASTAVVSAYQILVDLSRCCVSARNAVQTLDTAFFCQGDGLVLQHAVRHSSSTLSRSSGNNHLDGFEGTQARDLGQTGKQDASSIPIEQSAHANGLFDCLQQSYESLDNFTTTIPSL